MNNLPVFFFFLSDATHKLQVGFVVFESSTTGLLPGNKFYTLRVVPAL